MSRSSTLGKYCVNNNTRSDLKLITRSVSSRFIVTYIKYRDILFVVGVSIKGQILGVTVPTYTSIPIPHRKPFLYLLRLFFSWYK